MIINSCDYSVFAIQEREENGCIKVNCTEVDAGDIFLGQTAKFSFELKNDSDRAIKIKVLSSCGCTVVRCNEAIDAGGVETVEAELNTHGLGFGKITKSIFVNMEDREQKSLQLRLTARIVSVVTRLESDASPLELDDTRPTTREFQLRALGAEPVEITGASCSVDYARVKVLPLASDGADGQLYNLVVTVDPEAPNGRTPLTVMVATTAPHEPVVLVHYWLEKGILFTPGAIVLKGSFSDPELSKPTILKLKRREGAFQITKVDSDVFDLVVATETVRDGQEYQLQLSCRGPKTDGDQTRKGKVLIETDDPAQRLIEIPAFLLANPERTKN